MSVSDVYRRQILTYKDGPRTERVNPYSADLVHSRFCPSNKDKINDG